MYNFLSKLPTSYWIAAITTLVLFFVAVISPDSISIGLETLNAFIFDIFGNFYLWFVYLILIACVLLGVSPLGKIRIGGKDAKPQHSKFSWFSMLFCAGMGVGLLFWGGAEPLFFFMNPPIEGASTLADKEMMAFKFAFLHWGVHPWAIYCLTTIAISFFSMNLKRGLYLSSFLSDKKGKFPLLKKNTKSFVDNAAVIAILFGVVASFGLSVSQLEGGLQTLLNIDESAWTKIAIILGVTVCYIYSSLRGLNKGIKILSNISMVLCFVLLIAIACVIPIKNLLTPLTIGFQSYITDFTSLSLGQLNYGDPNFLQEWTTKYWAWWFAWAPFVGIFITMISKGRTIREIVFSMLLAPSLFSILWFSIFGEAAIILQQSSAFLGSSVNFSNVNLVLYKIVQSLFSSPVLNFLCILLVSIFFINSADSATYTLAAISEKTKKMKTPPLSLQFSWGITFSILSAVFIFTSGDVGILQQISIATVLPFSILLVFIFLKLFKELIKYYKLHYAKSEL